MGYHTIQETGTLDFTIKIKKQKVFLVEEGSEVFEIEKEVFSYGTSKIPNEVSNIKLIGLTLKNSPDEDLAGEEIPISFNVDGDYKLSFDRSGGGTIVFKKETAKHSATAAAAPDEEFKVRKKGTHTIHTSPEISHTAAKPTAKQV